MDKKLKDKLLGMARERITDDDPSHDFEHALRVLANAERIAKEEKADLDVIVPAALFHDLVNPPKNSPRAKYAADDSAEITKGLLEEIKEYPAHKIEKVYLAIKSCSFNKGISPELLEAKILQDADGLEATGAISIMRTFASTGQMKRPFYSKQDVFCRKREPDSSEYALDLFYTRLLKVGERMHTKSAKKIAKRRTRFLNGFLKELELELEGK
jgi:uncharacterized protein